MLLSILQSVGERRSYFPFVVLELSALIKLEAELLAADQISDLPEDTRVLLAIAGLLPLRAIAKNGNGSRFHGYAG